MCSRFAEETANPDKRMVSEKQITKYQYFAKFSKVHLKCTSLQVKVLFGDCTSLQVKVLFGDCTSLQV